MQCGIDICSVKRMQESIEKLGEHFLKHVFTIEEIQYCERKKVTKYESYAARFAGKEAVYKALGSQKGTFTEVEILHDKSRKTIC